MILNENISGMTCFGVQTKYEVCCQRKKCKHWFECKNSFNCILVASNEKSHTLQEISELTNTQKSKICSIKKNIIQKLKKTLSCMID